MFVHRVIFLLLAFSSLNSLAHAEGTDVLVDTKDVFLKTSTEIGHRDPSSNPHISMDQYLNLLGIYILSGKWMSYGDSNMDFFKNIGSGNAYFQTTGTIPFGTHTGYQITIYGQNNKSSMQITISEDPTIIGYSEMNATLNFFPNGLLNYTIYGDSINSDTKTCRLNVTYYFLNLDSRLPFNTSKDSIDSMGVQVEIHGMNDCEFSFISNIMVKDSLNKYWGWNITLTILLAFIGGYLYEELAKSSITHPVQARRTSLLMIMSLSVFDFNLLLINSSYFFYLFIDSAFLYLLLFIGYLYQVLGGFGLFILVSSLRGNWRSSTWKTRTTIFYVVVVLGIFVLFSLVSGLALFVVLAIHPICQIILTLKNNKKFQTSSYWVGVGVLKYFYMRVYPNYILKLSQPDYVQLWIGLALIFQWVILIVQQYRPRIFVGPVQYNYLIRTEQIPGGEVCPICIEEMITNQTALLGDPKFRVTKTFCGHYFHEACLNKWLESKFACPTCRRPLSDEY